MHAPGQPVPDVLSKGCCAPGLEHEVRGGRAQVLGAGLQAGHGRQSDGRPAFQGPAAATACHHQAGRRPNSLFLGFLELLNRSSPEGLLCLQVTEETEGLRFNTAIAAMMEFVNGAYKWELVPRDAVQPFVLLLAPYAPHLAEELWQVIVPCLLAPRMHMETSCPSMPCQ